MKNPGSMTEWLSNTIDSAAENSAENENRRIAYQNAKKQYYDLQNELTTLEIEKKRLEIEKLRMDLNPKKIGTEG